MRQRNVTSPFFGRLYDGAIRRPLPTPPRDNSTCFPPPRIGGLDGLRALAVASVIIYHLYPGSLPGGFVGVDVFFAISGFLITTLLLREYELTRRIRLASFWGRRARRLLPALFTVLIVCSAVTLFIQGDTAVQLGRQFLGAVTFSSNWLDISANNSYFTSQTPDLFRNLWSLAVEEQFYLVWPLLVWALAVLRRPRVAAIICVAVSAVSALMMGLTFAPTVDPTRVYFGTDTHCFGLMLGASLSFLLSQRSRPGPVVKFIAPLVGCLLLIVVAALACSLREDQALTYEGGLWAASAFTAVMIWAAAVPGSWFGALLDTPVLRAIGQRSYSLYLWHWPVFVLVNAVAPIKRLDELHTVVVGLVTCALTLIAAWASYRLIEYPFCAPGTRWARSRTKRQRLVLTITLSIGAILAAFSIANAPNQTQAQQAVETGLAAVKSHTPTPAAPPHTHPSSTPQPSTPTSGPTPVMSNGSSITAVGDSVMLAAAPALQKALPGIWIDAEVSRSPRTAPDLIESLAQEGTLRPIVVLGLGTNGYWGTGTLQRVLDVIGPNRKLILVTAYAPRDWIQSVNAYDAQIAAANPSQITIANWADQISNQTGLLNSDGIHPTPAGGALYANTLRQALNAAQ